MPKEIKSITDTLETMKEETQGDTIEMGELLEILNSRGYGPILLGPALIVVLPTGAIPIVPDICALSLNLLSRCCLRLALRRVTDCYLFCLSSFAVLL